MSVHVASLEALEADRIARPEAPLRALQRRFAGRYPVDPFGLDPQLADLFVPLFSAAMRIEVTGSEFVPTRGPATIVANRGFGFAEPAALGLAVFQATGRRLRIIGAPAIPVVGALTRRLGAIASSTHDVAAALHAGHLVGVPLAPTFFRTSAGATPLEVAPAITHSPIVPAAVHAVGRLGPFTGAWRVRFGPLVTLPETYDPNDPLAAARFADAVRSSVAALLSLS